MSSYTDNLSPSGIKAPLGWKRWRWVRNQISGSTTIAGSGNNVTIPSGQIPNTYLPTKSIWLDAETINCSIQLPWTLRDPFSEFLPFATTGGILGTIAGLAAAGSVMDEPIEFKLGLSYPNYDAPRLGYCIGSLLKEEVYTRLKVTKIDSGNILPVFKEDIVWRSKLKRMYLVQGEIKNVITTLDSSNKINPYKYIINLGFTKQYAYETTFSTRPNKVTITSSTPISPVITTPPPTTPPSPTSSSKKWNIDKLSSNGDLTISSPLPNDASNIYPSPQIGDFFQLDFAVCLEDPYMMDGFWLGDESEGQTGMPTSGYNFFATTANKPYQEGFFIGMYYPLDASISPVITATTPPTNPTTPTAVSKYIPSVGEKMEDDSIKKWYFVKLNSTNTSEINNDLFRFELIEDSGIDSSSVQLVKIGDGTIASATAFQQRYHEITFLRLELSKSGGPGNTNFHCPCLNNQYVKCGGQYFKILNQYNSYIIDVSIKSVDGAAFLDPFSSQKYSIVNEYAWMLNEYLMYPDSEINNQITNIFTGVIKEVKSSTPTLGSYYQNLKSITTVTITVDGNKENGSTWVDLPPRSYNSPSYLKPKSFINRFTMTHSHLTSEPLQAYDKGGGWILHIGTKQYIVLMETVTPPSTQGKPYDIDLIFSSEDSLNSDLVGKSSYISFDYPFPKKGTINSTLFVESMKQGIQKGEAFARLCMDAYWLSSQWDMSIGLDNKYIGICDGRYFGVTDETASSNDDATLFVTVPGGSPCISSLYHNTEYDNVVLYSDVYTRKLTLRQGMINYTENPKKIEVSIGNPTHRDNTYQSGTIFNFNDKYDRIKNITFDVPSVTNGTENPLYFSFNGSSDYFGFIVSGKGKLKLYGVPDTFDSSKFKFKGNPLSPVYIYKYQQDSCLKTQRLHIGWDTKDGPININNGSISNAMAEYVNNNQTLENVGLFDIFHISDGEMIMIYGQPFEKFSLKNGTTYNTSKWKYSDNVIMAIGSTNGGETWTCPIYNDLIDNGSIENTQYPLMIMNSTDYLTSIYSPTSQELMVISKCYTDDGNIYIGCLCIPVFSLSYKKFVCTPSSTRVSTDKFLWRPVAISDSILDNKDTSYLPPLDYVKDGYSWSANDSSGDTFTRIMGKDIINTYINANISNLETISAYRMEDGVCFILFSSGGLKAAYSQNFGRSWYLSAIILAKNTSGGVAVNGKLFYITTYGIECKNTNEANLEYFILTKVGTDAAKIELVQTEVNNIPSELIWSGNINPQKISGYINEQGIIKLFFYDVNNLLTCIQGVYGDRWEVAPNF